MRTRFVHGRPPPPFNFGNSIFHTSIQYAAWYATRAQYLLIGRLEVVLPCDVHELRHVYRAFIVPKPGLSKKNCKLVVDGRPRNPLYVEPKVLNCQLINEQYL